MTGMGKTLVCVAIAGILFIAAIIYGIKPLFLVAAFFDWLPVPTGWMRIGRGSPRVKRAGAIHGVITALAYAAGILWLIYTRIASLDLGVLFLELWFLAVIAGAYTTSLVALECIEGRESKS